MRYVRGTLHALTTVVAALAGVTILVHWAAAPAGVVAPVAGLAFLGLAASRGWQYWQVLKVRRG